ncbi:DUF2167 domain-containing protein [Sphingomonas sp. CJ20]
MRRLLGAGAIALAMFGTSAMAADKPAKAPPAENARAAKLPPKAQQFLASLHPQSGDVSVPAAKAVLHLGDRYYFLPADDAKRVLVDVWRNPPESVSDVLGMVMEKDANAFDNLWGAVITYQYSGHVSDADADNQDYGAVLADMKAGDAADNEQRKAQGFPAISLVGWAQPPSYDKASHSLIWARELAEEGGAEHGLNYDVRLLGRTGVLSLNMVSSMAALPEVRTAASDFGKAVTFEPGAAYADFNSSTDKTAEYGLAGLVAGGVGLAVVKKVGLLAILLKFGKLILLGIATAGAAAWGFIKRLAGRREEDAI